MMVYGGILAGAVVFGLIVGVIAWREEMAGSKKAAPAVAPADVDAFFASIEGLLAPTLRPVQHIALEPFADDDPVASKLGGRAWWPADAADPLAVDGNAMTLLAQVNFAEVPAMPGYPSAGLLQVFLSLHGRFFGANLDAKTFEELAEQREFRVAYWPDPGIASRVLPALAGDLPHAPDRPRRMRFTPGREGPSVGDHRFDALLGDALYDAADAFVAARGLPKYALSDAIDARFSGSGNKLGGYPVFCQSDPREGGDYELLLQLGSDREMQWSDMGVANFFIRPDDLARRDFSRVAYTYDST